MPKNEKQIQDDVRLHVASKGATTWRNNVGVATTANGAVIRYGLCTGSADLIGITPLRITPEMVGHTVGVFTAIEVKTPTGRPTKEQVNFIEHVQSQGGLASICREPSDYDDALQIFLSKFVGYLAES
jgi:hypothetical protein